VLLFHLDISTISKQKRTAGCHEGTKLNIHRNLDKSCQIILNNMNYEGLFSLAELYQDFRMTFTHAEPDSQDPNQP